MLWHERTFDEAEAAPRVAVWSGNNCTLTPASTDTGRADGPGYRFDQAINRHEILVKGIGADTWTVSYIGQDGVTRVYNDNGGAGFVEGDSVIVRDVRPTALIVALSGATGAGSRVVTLVSTVRNLEE
jgi:hypothetical protein